VIPVAASTTLAQMPALEMREWTTRLLAGVALTDSDRRLASALGDGEPRLIVDELRDGVRVTARSWIGVVRFDSFEVTVVPKVAGGNLGVLHMLEYASGFRALEPLESERSLAVAKRGRLPDLIGLLLADATRLLVRDGLLSDYVTREETLTTLRGRLRVDDQVRRRFLQVDRLECRFDEHETDIVENRLLAAALAIARRVCVDDGVRRSVGRYHSIRRPSAGLSTRAPRGRPGSDRHPPQRRGPPTARLRSSSSPRRAPAHGRAGSEAD